MSRPHRRVRGVYAIVCVATGQRYIGSSIDMVKRWGFHLWELRSRRRKRRPLQVAWDKYGEDKFRFIVLEFCADSVDPKDAEQRWLDSTRNKLNEALDTHSSWRGRKIPKTTHDAMMAKVKGRIVSEQTRARLRAAHLGSKLSAEHRSKIAASGLGRIASAATRAKISDKAKGNTRWSGRHHSEETRARMALVRNGWLPKKRA